MTGSSCRAKKSRLLPPQDHTYVTSSGQESIIDYLVCTPEVEYLIGTLTVDTASGIPKHRLVSTRMQRTQLEVEVDVVMRHKPWNSQPIFGQKWPIPEETWDCWNETWKGVIDQTLASNNGYTRQLPAQREKDLSLAYQQWAETVEYEYRMTFGGDKVKVPGMKPNIQRMPLYKAIQQRRKIKVQPSDAWEAIRNMLIHVWKGISA